MHTTLVCSCRDTKKDKETDSKLHTDTEKENKESNINTGTEIVKRKKMLTKRLID